MKTMTKKEIQDMQKHRLDFIRDHPGLTLSEISEIFSIDRKYTWKCINTLKKMDPGIYVRPDEDPNAWTETEISFLSANRNRTIKWIAENNPGHERTAWAVSKKMQSLNMSQKRQSTNIKYSIEQEAFLKENKTKPTKWILENMPEPKKSERSIRQKFRQMKISRRKPNNHPYKTNPKYPRQERHPENYGTKPRVTDEQVRFIQDNMNESDTWISEHMPEPKKSRSTVNRIKKRLQTQTT